MKKLLFKALSALLLVTGLALFMNQAALGQEEAEPARPLAYVIEVKSAITPSTYDLIGRHLKAAHEAHADIVILEMHTPGGLYDSMQEIITDILESPVPVATYVSPPGSHAASAGTYILYGSHIAAMAPNTNIGAATPINMMGGGDKQEEGADGQKRPQSTLEHKMVNDASAYIRGLASRYGRNGEWAEKAVREADSITETEALQKKVIDVIANDVPDLLNKIDGRTVRMANDKTIKLVTRSAKIVKITPDWRTRLLDIIANPNVAFLLMTLGSYGLLYELMNPGTFVPGVIGAICLLLGLFAMNVLPINYAGLALLLLGIILMTGEAFAPSFGVLGIGGAISFAAGATMLIDSTDPAFAIDPWMIAGVTLASLLFFSVLIAVALKAQRRGPVTGIEELKSSIADVLNWSQGEGEVRVTGEVWKAKASAEFIINPGDRVKVVDIDGLRLIVKPEQA